MNKRDTRRLAQLVQRYGIEEITTEANRLMILTIASSLAGRKKDIPLLLRVVHERASRQIRSITRPRPPIPAVAHAPVTLALPRQHRYTHENGSGTLTLDAGHASLGYLQLEIMRVYGDLRAAEKKKS